MFKQMSVVSGNSSPKVTNKQILKQIVKNKCLFVFSGNSSPKPNKYYKITIKMWFFLGNSSRDETHGVLGGRAQSRRQSAHQGDELRHHG